MNNHKATIMIVFVTLALSLFMSAGIAWGNQWINIGPAPITVSGGPYSGRVADIAVDPNDSNHWLIGAALGGIWETYDAGTTWVPRTDDQPSQAMGAIAFANSDPRIVYAGTGEAVWYTGAGLLKSTDGGTTWQLINDMFERSSFSDIKIDPTNSDILLAATNWGQNYPLIGAPDIGIFKSTDSGATWVLNLKGQAWDLEVDPNDFNNQYTSIGDIFGQNRPEGAQIGIYRSTDAGETWKLIDGPWTTDPRGVGRIELAIAPSNPDVLYVTIQDAVNGVGNDKYLLGLWRTDNAWDSTPTWVEITLNFNGYVQDGYNLEIIVDPMNENTLFHGALDLWRCDDCRPGGSQDWNYISRGIIHADQHTMAWADGRLIVGNDGGVYSTSDSGNTWENHNTNLSITQFYHGSVHPTAPNFALAGSQDNGTSKWTGTDEWQKILRADGSDNAISSSNPDTHWAVSQQWGRWLGIKKTMDGGLHYYRASSGLDWQNGDWLPLFEMCPANHDIFITGTDNIWRTDNFFSSGTSSPSWYSNSEDFQVIRDSTTYHQYISALAFAQSDSNCGTYAFGAGAYRQTLLGLKVGYLRLTIDEGTNWFDIDTNNDVPDRPVTDLAFHPENPEILYVTLGDYNERTPDQPGHVFLTRNALSGPFRVWFNVSPPVNVPHNTILLDPLDPNIVYVGTDRGVWRRNSDKTWTHMGPSSGMPNTAVYDLQANTLGDIFAFTFGRGAYKLIRECSPPPSGLVSWWPFDEGDGTTASDIIGVKDGNLVDGPSWTSGIDKALKFDGIDDYIEVPDDNSLDLNPSAFTFFTFEAWVYFSKGGVTILDKNSGESDHDTNYRWIIGLWDHADDTRLGVWNGGSQSYPDPVFANTNLSVNTWHHIAVVYDAYNLEVEFYVDGKFDGSDLWDLGNPNRGPLHIGKDYMGRFFEGAIDELTIYNRALTESEIQAIYNAGSAGKCKDAVSIWGDLNSDGCVDREDLSEILAVIRGLDTPAPSINYDLNSDGVVNIADARYLVTLFTNPGGAACE